MESIFTTTINELRCKLINEIQFHLESRNIERLTLNSNVYAGENMFNSLTYDKALSVFTDDILDECEYNDFAIEELDSIMSLLSNFNYKINKQRDTEIASIDENILSSVYYKEILEITNKYNCVIEKVTERDFIAIFSMVTTNRDVHNLMKDSFNNVSFGKMRNSIISNMKGGKKYLIQTYFILNRSVSVKPLINGLRGTQLVKLLDTYNIITNEQFNLKLSELVYNMSKYCHTIKGQERKELRSLKKSCVKFLFNRNAFDKIDECESTLGDTLNGFYIGNISFHLRHHDFHQFYHGCYANQVEVVSELYDGSKRDLSNIDMEFKEYLPVFKDINDVFVNAFLKINL